MKFIAFHNEVLCSFYSTIMCKHALCILIHLFMYHGSDTAERKILLAVLRKLEQEKVDVGRQTTQTR
jgi:hypothetical protein